MSDNYFEKKSQLVLVSNKKKKKKEIVFLQNLIARKVKSFFV